MELAPPVLLAVVLAAASLTSANAQAPTKLQRSRISGGPVIVPVEPALVAASAVETAASAPGQSQAQSAMPSGPAQARGQATPHPAMKSGGNAVVAQAAAPARTRPRASNSPAAAGGSTGNAVRSCTTVDVDPTTVLTLGKSRVVRLPFPATRLVVGGQPGSSVGTAGTRPAEPAAGATPGGPAAMARPAQAPAQEQRARPREDSWDGVARTDVVLLSPTELFFLGRRPGAMNVVLQGADGHCLVKDIVVTIDPDALQAKITELMPEEHGIKVRGADDAFVLTGAVSDSVKLSHVLALAGGYGDGKKVVNLLRVSAPQQVMLEVTIAEVSKTLLSRFGLDFSRMVRSGDGTIGVMSGIVGGAPGLLARFAGDVAATAVAGAATVGTSNSSGSANSTAGTLTPRQFVNPDGSIQTRFTLDPATISKNSSVLGIDAKKNDGIVRVLAEPNIMAISGQPASFLSGGRIFIPVAQSAAIGGAPTITLQEKEFGVSLKFTPTVLDGAINLKVTSEVSELSQTGSPFTTIGGVTSVIPSLTTRQVDTTVQLGDGQSFAVAGLIKNNMAGALDKFPGLGDAPVVGALFRSSEFQTDQSELMFVVTPRLVKPVVAPVVLPTDNHSAPNADDALFGGKGEGPEPPPMPQPAPERSAPAAAPAPTRP